MHARSFAFRSAAAVTTAAAALTSYPASSHASVGVRACSDADLVPATGNLRRVRVAIRCLHNRRREERGLPALRESVRLRRAAIAHSEDMVAAGYFDHTSPSGVTLTVRVASMGYDATKLAEHLATGSGEPVTPRGLMHAWMNSDAHRASIIDPDLRDIGIGVRTGIPGQGGSGATITCDLGAR